MSISSIFVSLFCTALSYANDLLIYPHCALSARVGSSYSIPRVIKSGGRNLFCSRAHVTRNVDCRLFIVSSFFLQKAGAALPLVLLCYRKRKSVELIIDFRWNDEMALARTILSHFNPVERNYLG